MDLGLEGSVAFITGASKGIGRECARVLAEEGCTVVITARGRELLEKTARELSEATGQKIAPIAGDMSKPEDVERAAADTISSLGKIDILITCAGSSPGGLLENLTEDEWFSSLNLKFMGYVQACRAVLPHMREQGGGSVVLVVGNDGLKPTPWETTAGVANAADINYSQSVLSLNTDLEVRGKAAQFGRGVLGNVSQRILDQFARNLESEVLSSRETEEPPSEEGAPTEEAGRSAPVPPAAPAGGESLDVLSLLGGPPMLRQAAPVVAGLIMGLLLGNFFASRKTLRAYQEALRVIGHGPMYGPPARRWRGS